MCLTHKPNLHDVVECVGDDGNEHLGVVTALHDDGCTVTVGHTVDDKVPVEVWSSYETTRVTEPPAPVFPRGC